MQSFQEHIERRVAGEIAFSKTAFAFNITSETDTDRVVLTYPH